MNCNRTKDRTMRMIRHGIKSLFWSGIIGVTFQSGFAETRPSPVSPVQVLASGSNGLQEFGNSVAIHSDTIVIGAPWTGSSLTGAAYIYARQGASWVLEQKLLPP